MCSGGTWDGRGCGPARARVLARALAQWGVEAVLHAPPKRRAWPLHSAVGRVRESPRLTHVAACALSTALTLVLIMVAPPSRARASRKRCAAEGRPEYVPGVISDPNYLRIFDTTLRDGEQSPGAALTCKQKLDIARQLARLGVDIIEAGFPRASPDDLEAVRQIAKDVGCTPTETGHIPVICGLSRANKEDIDAAWEAVRHAQFPRIHTFIATSPIHMEAKLRMTPDEVVAQAVEAVTYARSLGCDDVEFSPEDAGRSELPFLYRILTEVIKAGATTINIPDTVGYTIPNEFGSMIEAIRANVPGLEGCVVSTHCQNDLGLATANSLAGAAGGARQVECTINGIGERAGNASLEEVVMAVAMRGKEQFGGMYTGIDTKYITSASRMVSEYTGMLVQPHKAIVGANAFAHESGIHQDGMLKDKSTYEIMTPESVGLLRDDDAGLVMGKHSGRHALRTRLADLGYTVSNEDMKDVFARFKALADTKKIVTDEDLQALVMDEVFQPTEIWHLDDMQIVCGTMGMPTATVRLVGPDGVRRTTSAVGTGPVDAAYKAVQQIVQVPVELTEFGMNAVTEGIDALANTRVMVADLGEADGVGSRSVNPQTGEGRDLMYSGMSADSDVVVASTKAYINALNKLLGMRAAKNAVSESETSESDSEGAAAAAAASNSA